MKKDWIIYALTALLISSSIGAADPETTGAVEEIVELNADKKKVLNFSPVKLGDWKAAQELEAELSSWQNYEVSFELRLPPEYELKPSSNGNSRSVSLLEISWGTHPSKENPNQQAVAYLQLQRSPSKPHRFAISGPYIRWYGKNEGFDTIEFRESAKMPAAEGEWQKFHLKQDGKRVEISINGTLVFAATDERMMPGGVTIRSWLSEDLMPTSLALRGVSVNKK